jgi:hypothetical protein
MKLGRIKKIIRILFNKIKNFWKEREGDGNFWGLFFSVPFLLVFIYSFTVLVQIGENSYFNIPFSFVDTSLASFVVWGYILIGSVWGVVHAGWLAAIVVLVITVFYFLVFGPKIWYKALAAVLMLLCLYFSPKIGNFIAENQNYFYVTVGACQNVPEGDNVAVNFYNDKIVFLSLDKSTSSVKMTNEFFVRDVASLNCKIKLKKIGKIEK